MDLDMGLGIVGVLLVIVLWLILHTSIISDKVEKKVKRFEEEHIKNKKN